MPTDEVTGELVEGNTLALVEKAKLDGAVAWAKNNPRKPFKTIRERCWETIADDQEILENSYYEIPGRKNKKTGQVSAPYVGPNIRLAEIWGGEVGNAALGIGFAEVNRGERMVTVRAFCHDLEKNTRIEEEYSTRILWQTDDGVKNALDRARSYAFRNCITRMFGVHVRMLAEKARLAVENTSDVEGAWKRTLKAFGPWEVTEQDLLDWLEREHGKVQDAELSGEHIAHLRGCYQAILNNYTTVEDQFHPDQAKEQPAEAEVDLAGVEVKDPPPPKDQKRAEGPQEPTDGEKSPSGQQDIEGTQEPPKPKKRPKDDPT